MDFSHLVSLFPVFLFLLILLYISYRVQRTSEEARSKNFAKDYFIGGRTLGGFVLAMTTVATYSSVSTFVGGPGVAWQIGYGWLYMAIVQVVVVFLVMGVFGKKISLVARDIDAVTVIDILRARYKSDSLCNLAAIFIVAFFCATMVAQFVGAAKLFEAVTGYSYVTGLTLFGIIVIIYTTIGGFKGVAITDAICAIAMIVGMSILFYCMLDKAGGYGAIMNHIRTNDPAMLEPLSRGKMPISLYISQWLLVGVCTLALPQSIVRSISYKDTRSLRNAIIIGTVVIGAMTLIATWVGVLSKGILTNPSLAAYGGSVDNITPRTIVSVMSPFWRHHPRADCGDHLDRVVPMAHVVVVHHQGHLHACPGKERQDPEQQRHPEIQHGRHHSAGLRHLLYRHRPAVGHLENQHVRFRRPGNGLLLGHDLRPVLA